MACPPTDCTLDELLVARARAGQLEAFDRLVRRHRQRVLSLALRLLGNSTEAEEVAQETFVLLYRKLAGFRGDAKLSTWLYRVTVNAARMHRRRAVRRYESASLEDHPGRVDEEGRSAPPADELLERGQLLRAISRAVVQLPALYRETFVLRDLEERSTEETARALGLEAGVVRTRLHRARLLVRGYLEAGNALSYEN
jgi:RNA polymerase sigma-70 factor (ECF subfamily)